MISRLTSKAWPYVLGLLAIIGSALFIYKKGESAGENKVNRRNQEAMNQARKDQDDAAQDIDRLPDSDLDNELRQR